MKAFLENHFLIVKNETYYPTIQVKRGNYGLGRWEILLCWHYGVIIFL